MTDAHAAKPLRKSDILVQELGEQTVLYRTKGKAIHVLNPTARLIWGLCDGQHYSRLSSVRRIESPSSRRKSNCGTDSGYWWRLLCTNSLNDTQSEAKRSVSKPGASAILILGYVASCGWLTKGSLVAWRTNGGGRRVAKSTDQGSTSTGVSHPTAPGSASKTECSLARCPPAAGSARPTRSWTRTQKRTSPTTTGLKA